KSGALWAIEIGNAGCWDREFTMRASTGNGSGNRILDLLLRDESRRLLSSSQVVSMPSGYVVFRQDGPVPHAYFPTTGVFGVVVATEEGRQVEGVAVGNEGMIGLPLFLGVDSHPFTVVSQVPGEALQVP